MTTSASMVRKRSKTRTRHFLGNFSYKLYFTETCICHPTKCIAKLPFWTISRQHNLCTLYWPINLDPPVEHRTYWGRLTFSSGSFQSSMTSLKKTKLEDEVEVMQVAKLSDKAIIPTKVEGRLCLLDGRHIPNVSVSALSFPGKQACGRIRLVQRLRLHHPC